MQAQILVPLDGSALAECILPHAQIVAQSTGRGLTLVRVVPPPAVADPVLSAAVPHGDAAALRALQLHAGDSYLQLVAEGLPPPVQRVRLEGDPATEIVAYALHHPEVELVAMATHGRNGLGRLVLGSVADAVLAEGAVPLLLVRPDSELPAAPPPVYRTILVPLDGSDFAERALDPACRLAAALGATLLLLTVDKPPPTPGQGPIRPGVAADPGDSARELQEYLRATTARLVAAGFPVLAHLAQGSAAAAICDTSERQHCDLIVMATHGRAGLERLRLGSVARQVVRGTTRPVLLYCRQAHPARQTDRAAAHADPPGVRWALPGAPA